MQKVETLYRLQLADLELEDKARRLLETEARLGESPELLAAREALQTGEVALRQAEADLREREFQVSRAENKLREVNVVLYSPNPKRTAKELANLQKEAELLQLQKGRAEELALACMDQVEELQAEHRRLRVALADADQVWRQEQRDLEAQRQSLLGEQAKFTSARTELVRSADPTHLNVYDGLRRQKGGRAVARVEQSVCTGCRIAMALQVVQRARANPGLTFCSTCGRILYVPH